MVRGPNAIPHPRTMMIESCNATVTMRAMFRPQWFLYQTCGAKVFRVEMSICLGHSNNSLQLMSFVYDSSARIGQPASVISIYLYHYRYSQ